MYSNLFVKTNYSLLSSLISPEKLVNFAVKKNIDCLVICDDKLNAVMSFYKACQKHNIKPVVALDTKYKDAHILLFAKNYESYLQLIKLVTKLEIEDLDVNDLKENSDLFYAVLPFDSLHLFEELSNVYSDLYLAASSKIEENNLLNYSEKIVFINETRYLNNNDREFLKYLYMIRDGKTIADETDYDLIGKHYLSDAEAEERASRKALRASKHITDNCNLIFKKNEDLMPIYENKLGDSEKYLKELSIRGLSLRLKNQIPDEYKERLIHELSIIKQMGFSDYFLITYDFIKYAKKAGILVGPGRGSVGGSLVAYSLGITDIDPIKYKLFFERFLNVERVTMPDIDTDFPDTYRDQVIDYVIQKYGKKKVAGIITYGTLAARQVLRDCGRLLNADMRLVEKLCHIIPSVSNKKLHDFYNEEKHFKDIIDSDDKMTLLFQIAKKIEGFPRHSSIHAAGIVISKKDLDEVVPLVKSNEHYLVAYSLEHLEDIGLLKMDFLGVKNLSTIMNIIQEVNEKENKKLSFNDIPLEDNAVNELFSRGDTLGIFQFESIGMRRFLKSLKPSSFSDVVAAIALFRPGPNVNIPSYIARKEGKEKIEYLDPALEEILKETYGIIVYQEQIMQIANQFAGLTMAEADLLRVAMSKKDKNLLEASHQNFVDACIKNGHSKDLSEKLFELILKFAGYGFNKSHSVAYSIVAFRMAYLKAKYPKYFFSNLLSSIVGNPKKTKEYLEEAKRLKVKILAPDIQKSASTYLIEEDALRFPISGIEGIGNITAKAITTKKDYKDIYDAYNHLLNSGVNKKMLEDMIYVSCFQSFSYNNHTLIHNLDSMINYASLINDLDESLIIKPEISRKAEYSREFLAQKEKEILGFYLSDHPSSFYKENYKVVNLIDIEKYFDKLIDTIVLVESKKEIKTKKNDAMSFLLASDDTSQLDYTLFPRQHEAFNVNQGDILLIKGRVEKRLDKFQIIVQNIKKLND